MTTSALLTEWLDDRVVVTLHRPAVRNAIDQQMIDELHAVCERVEAEPRIVIVTGSDGVFAGGADIAQLRARRADDARRGINTMAFRRVRDLAMPVIAAVDGWALGAGAELAYAADLRLGTPSTRIGNPEVKLGIIAAAGATWRLPEIVGHARASELLFTGRVLDADEALAWGLLNSIHAPDDLLGAAHSLADRIAQNDPLAVRHTKTALAAPAERHPEIDLDLQAELFESPEKMRRMTEFLERSKR